MNKINFYFKNNLWPFIDEHLDKNLYSNKKILVFVDSFPTFQKNKDEIWIYLQVESTLISGECIVKLMKDDSLFDIIFTWDPNLLKKNKSIKFMSNNKVYWVSPTYDLKKNLNLPNNNPIEYNIINKKFQVSMLCGGKNWCPGHKIRREYWDNQNKITIPKKFVYSHNNNGLKIFENNKIAIDRKDKTELFIDSMFHIAIENNKAINYFTEKLIDCIVSKTIPIYYGCPNIHEYFNIKGFIVIDNINDLSKINELTEEYYNNHLSYIEENYNKLLSLPSFKDQFIENINNNFEESIIYR